MIGDAGGLSGGRDGDRRRAPGAVGVLLLLAATAVLSALLGRFLFYPLLTNERVDEDVEDNSDVTFQFSDLISSSPGDGKRTHTIFVGPASEPGAMDRIDRPKHGGDGPVVGPAFAPWDQTFPLTGMGLGLDFRAPPGWLCQDIASKEASARGVTTNYCAHLPELGPGGPYSDSLGDQSNYVKQVLGRPLLGPGPVRGFVVVSPCRDGGCDPDDGETLDPRTTFDAGFRSGPTISEKDYSGPVKRPDATTAFVEQTGDSEMDGQPRYLISMVHLYRPQGEGGSRARVLVTLAGPPEAREEMQKVVNDVREATP